MSQHEIVINQRTPFKEFKVRAHRQCNGCRTSLPKDSTAWKPHGENEGSWTNDARLCGTCVWKAR